MKTLTLLISLTLITTLIACSPEDNKIERPANSKQGGGPTSSPGLRFGSYGQTIWAVQNVEQVGMLMAHCLESNKPIKRSDAEITKSCAVKFFSDRISERWTVQLKLKELSENNFQIEYAQGRLENGHATTVFNKINAFIRYDLKKFIFERHGSDFAMEYLASGNVGTATETIPYDQEITVMGQIQGSEWNFNQFEQDLILLTKAQKFKISSNNLKLNWVSSVCGEPEGVMVATEAGRSSSEIQLSGTAAKQVKGNWTQNYLACRARNADDTRIRKTVALNLEFLFY